MIKKFFSALLVVLFATSVMAQSGLTCDDPIPVDENYVGTVDGPCTLWYVANTYDLPLNVHFIPTGSNSLLSPEVEVDLTCVPGIYDDPKVDSLINMVEDFDISFPLEFMCNLVTINGKNAWDLAISNNYREQMAEFGITYNVPAYVKVTFYEGGEIRLKPDTAFSSCVENSHYVHLGDTLNILANDSTTSYIFPYTDWQNDSIRYVWEGDMPAQVWLGTMQCDFVPEANNGFVYTNYTVTSANPHKLYTQQMKEDIKAGQSGGLFYAKIITPVAGKFVVEKIPMAEVKDDITLLEYGKSVNLLPNDTNRLFCFPRTWKGTQFVSSTDYILTMYASASKDFSVSSNTVARRIYPYVLENGTRVLYMSEQEMKVLTNTAVDDYIYVRFVCNAPVAITPEEWESSSCANKSTLISNNKKFTVAARSSNTIYRLRYDDWNGYGLTIQWEGNVNLPTYIADACSFTLSSTNSHVLKYASIKRKSSIVLDSAEVASWASGVDEDGYLYVRFNPTAQGSVTFISDKPEETDPEIITNECVEGSIKLNVGDQITLNLDSAFTVYCFNYAEWAAQNVTFQWAGEEALHTFVAETCQFAVAPYNKYVVNYVAIPAQGKLVLDAATLAAFADKVDDAGYLYIRFLTEKEGTLTIK